MGMGRPRAGGQESFSAPGPTVGNRLPLPRLMLSTAYSNCQPTLRAGAAHTLKRLSRWHLRWRIAAVSDEPIFSPSLQQLGLLRDGDFAILIPPTSKADQFGLEWGPSPIYLRYSTDESVNAARELRDLEVAWPVEGDARRSTPLFVSGNRQAMTQDALRAAFKARLRAGGFDHALIDAVSLHSFRVYLACALLALKRSHDEIKALLRWRSDEALRIYARLTPAAYADLLVGVGDADVASRRSHNLPQQVDVDARVGALIRGRGALEQAAGRADARDAEADGDGAHVEAPDSEADD